MTCQPFVTFGFALQQTSENNVFALQQYGHCCAPRQKRSKSKLLQNTTTQAKTPFKIIMHQLK